MGIPTSSSPSKNYSPAVLLVLLLVLTVGVSLLPGSWFGIPKATRAYPTLELNDLMGSNEGLDNNKDGQVSWKEYVSAALDIPPDTDTQFEVDTVAVAQLNDPNNLTASFSKNLFLANTALINNGITDEETRQGLINQLIDKELEKVIPHTYTQSELTIVDDSKQSLTVYGNAMGKLLDGAISDDSVSKNLQALNAYLTNSDEGALLPLLEDTIKINKLVGSMAEVKVPRSAVSIHLETLNSFGLYRDTLSNLSAVQTDALRAQAGTRTIKDAVRASIHSYVTLSTFFHTKAISYTSKEPGYLFTYGYTVNKEE